LEVRGEWETRRVWLGDRELRPARSQQVRNDSPEGFSWGSGGSGSVQLALALLLEMTTEDVALLCYQEVKWNVIARLPQDDFVLDSQQIVALIVGEVNTEFLSEEGLQDIQHPPQDDETSPAMQTTAIDVDFRYTREDLKAIFDLAYDEDVERGGQYDGRSGAIKIYTHPWNNEIMRAESTIMGTLYAVWGQGNQIWQIEIEEGFSLRVLLKELGELEGKALSRKIHGG
jgi:hypothetical protein